MRGQLGRGQFWCVCLVGLIAPFLVAGRCGAEEWRLVVRQSIDGSLGDPVLLSLNESVPEGSYRIEGPGLPNPFDAQVFEDSGRWLAFIADRTMAEGTYVLRQSSPDGAGARKDVELVASGSNLRVEILGNLFTEYRTDEGAKPFFHPLNGPSGQPYTRAYPMRDVPGEDRDHPHQRSLWFTHGKVNGIDFWSEQSGHGTIRETGSRVVRSGPVLGRLHTHDEWLGPDGKVVCTDERIATFFRTASIRVLDFEIILKASAGPVTFGDTKEGMFGLRVASSMDVNRKKGGRILNAEGLTDDAAWGKASPWVDYTGPVEGKTAGIAVLNHPRSFRHPTHWHVRTYGLFAANPFGWKDFGVGKSGSYTLPRGESLTFAYRLILHEGDAMSARIGDHFLRYAEPPSVSVER